MASRILIATGIFPPQAGGPATYSKLLLEKLPEKGFDVRVQSFGWVIHYPKVIRHVAYFLKIFSFGFKTDVIYAQDPVSVGLPAMLAAKIIGKKFYLKIVGDYAWEQGVQRFKVEDLLDEFSTRSKGYGLTVYLLKRIQYFVASQADGIVVPSNYLKRIITNWGVNPGKITVIYNAFQAPGILPDKDVLRREYKWQGKVVFTAGRLVPWKGFETLISIWPELMEDVPGAVLFIAGDGPDKNKLEELIQQSDARDSIHLLGKLAQEKLFENIRASNLFVLNTAYEGLSHQLLEVMALGTPIVTTNVGGNPEVIADGESGFLVPYNDREALKKAMKVLLLDEELSLKFVLNAKNRLSRFNEEKMLDQLKVFLKA